MIVINLKEAGRHEELGHGSLYIKIQKKMTELMLANYNRWVFEHKKPEFHETLREWIIQEAEFQTVAAETLCGVAGRSKEGARPFFDRQEHKERLKTLTASFAGKTTPCGVVKSLRKWMSKAVGLQLNN